MIAMRSRCLVWIAVIAVAASLKANDGASGLIEAVKNGDAAAARKLIAAGGSANESEADGTTALHWAVRSDDVELVSMMLRAGADVRAANRYGVRPLSLAALNGNAAMIERLLDAGADPNTGNPEGETALMTAARAGSVSAVRLLAARGADVRARERWLGETPLIWAAAENHADVVRLLIELGADVNERSDVTDTPKLDFPRSGGPNSPFPVGGWTPLMYAARQGAIDTVSVLADAGANLNVTDPDGTTALVLAITNAHFDVAKLLVEEGADPNIADSAGMAALYAAVDMSSLQWVQGRPAPLWTSEVDAAGLVRILLEHGADANARLRQPALKRHHNAADRVMGAGTTPLMRAARLVDAPVVRILLEGGADPFLTQQDYTTALMMAAGTAGTGVRGEGPRIALPTEEGALEVIELLLERGVDVNDFNAAGMTALHGAVSRGDRIVRLLVSRGARINVKNKAGRTPLDLALGAGGGRGGGAPRKETAALLKQLMIDNAPEAVPSQR
jgi:ankyrin repeat protein